MKRISVSALAALGGILLAACSGSAQSARASSSTDVAATVGGVSITLGEVDERALQQPVNEFGDMRLWQALYEARLSAIDSIVGDKLMDQEAKARGITREALMDQEITTKVKEVTEADVVAWFQANPARVRNATLDQVRTPIRSLLIGERTRSTYQTYVNQLKGKTSVRVLIDSPRQKVAAADSPAQGPANAPVEVIEFSDFQCPFCLAAYPTVTRVMKTYGDNILFVYRHYPLPNHPNARPAAEAAQCAAEQGKFWPYHDQLFSDPTKLSADGLKQSAATIGLDTGKFNSCFDTQKYKARVDVDIQAGNQAGVSGTPAFFINGRVLTGAQPFDEFKRVIDEELARGNR